MRAGGRTALRDTTTWCVAVAVGLALTAICVAVHLHVGTGSPPFTGSYRLKIRVGSLLGPLVAGLVLTAVARGVPERLRWWALLGLTWLSASAWAIGLALVDGGAGLAGPVAGPQGLLRDQAAVGAHPARFLRDFVAHAASYTVSTRQHPPGAVLLVWLLHPLGLARPASLGVVVTLLGCLTPVFVTLAVRSLCGEGAARRLVPVLVLAPWALWTAVSVDGVTSAVCAAGIAAGVHGSERGRSGWWALAGGALLGTGALLSYSAGWLGATLLAVFFLRRRPWLNVVGAIGAMIPLGLARLAGFVWPDGLTAAQTDFSVRIGAQRSWLVWIPLSLLLLALACGPGLAAAARKWRRTPGWPFLVGAGLAVVFALASGLSRGEVERSWLPFFPWLLVPAVAPEPGTEPDAEPGSLLLLAGLGAAAAVVIEAVVASPW